MQTVLSRPRLGSWRGAEARSRTAMALPNDRQLTMIQCRPAVCRMKCAYAWHMLFLANRDSPFRSLRETRREAISAEQYVLAFGRLRCVLASAIVLATTSASAAPHPCRDDHALYRATTNARYEIEFLRPLDRSMVNRAGILRYRGKAHVFEYEFAIIYSNKIARPNLLIIENSSAPRNPEDDDNEEIKDVGPHAPMLQLGPDFAAAGDTPWAPYLVFPDLAVSFREWFKQLSKHPDVPPPQAWKLVPCSGDYVVTRNKLPPREPGREENTREEPVGLPPASPPGLWWRYEERH
jgi:hypothetical protein